MSEIRLGPYRLLDLIDEGSMGRVYRAAQDNPSRVVALKVMKRVSKDSAQRFALEAELMAQLDHPNIAQIFSAGEGELHGEAVSYFTMEFVDGQALDVYAQNETLANKINLLSGIADAVHYSHTHGVVHRDLKPSNILINQDGQPKIVDFGIARFVEDQAVNMTAAGEILGSVPYMSPEQFSGKARQTGPSTDIYSLGVIAYELLSGRHPYPGLENKTVVDAIHSLRNERPQALSRTTRLISKDLETVVMKAMASTAEGRYGSALAFAEDLRRILNHEPISARPPSLSYTLKLLVRRHRAASAALAGVMASIVAAALLALQFGIKETKLRQETEQRITEYQAILDFTREIFDPAHRQFEQGSQAKVIDLLEPSYERFKSASEQPDRVRANLAHVLSGAFQYLGESERALALIQDSIRFSSLGYGQNAVETITVRKSKIQILTDLGRIDEAAQEIDIILKNGFPDSEQGRFERVGIALMSAVNAVERGQPQVALNHIDGIFNDASLQVAVKIQHADINLMYWRSKALDLAGDLSAAIAAAEDTLKRASEVWSDDNPGVTYSQSGLARLYTRAGRFPEAEHLLRTSMASTVKREGPTHFIVAGRQIGIAQILLQQARYQEAIELAASAMQTHLAHSGEDTREYLEDRRTLAIAYARNGQLSAAKKLFHGLLKNTRAILGEEHPHSFESGLAYSEYLRLAQQHNQALNVLLELEQKGAQSLGEHHYLRGQIQLELAKLYQHMNEPEKVQSALQSAQPILSKHFGPEHPLRQTAEKLRANQT